jgi:hypothetical protein
MVIPTRDERSIRRESSGGNKPIARARLVPGGATKLQRPLHSGKGEITDEITDRERGEARQRAERDIDKERRKENTFLRFFTEILAERRGISQ